MRIDMVEIGGSRVLAGAVSGQQGLARLIERLGVEPDRPEILYLDFENVEVATVSHLRESVLGFRDYVRDRKPMLYPVIANAKETVRDDLMELMKARGSALMGCHLDKAGRASDAAPIGEMEPKQKLTFELVHKHGQTNAVQLMRLYGQSERTTSVTAWNNRLSGLADLGLVVVESHGRAKRYRPLFEGV